jgi:hypothetical protein
MNAQQQKQEASQIRPGAPAQPQRKAWKKKTPAEVILEQINKVREDVTSKEESLRQAKRQLEKLEEVRKVLEKN